MKNIQFKHISFHENIRYVNFGVADWLKPAESTWERSDWPKLATA
jgi:hypothetical protein